MKGSVATAVMMLAGCAPSPSATPPDPSAAPQPDYVGKVWVSTDPGAAPGTFRIFLGDGTLVMDSCWETYRLAPWRAVDPRRIEWTEDGMKLVAEIAQLADGQLQLRLQLRGEIREETYRVAQAPTVCPDMPR